jgi:hypothetical protein
MRLPAFAVVLGLTFFSSVGLSAQAVDPGPVFRVFLKDGRALASYGEAATYEDRVIFTLMVGDGAVNATQYQLISLPATSIDLDRTARYRDAVRAARYAATRGETDYAEMTAEVSRAIDEIGKVQDAKQRLAMAEEAKRRLLLWSRDNYGYRAQDIQELAGLFDEVIAEMRATAGESQFSVDLVAGNAPYRFEPLQSQPSLQESIELALAAAATVDVAADRTAILDAAAAALAAAKDKVSVEVVADVTRRIDAERGADKAYETLATDVRARAKKAADRGDVRGVSALRTEVHARDKALGAMRPAQITSILQELDSALEIAQARRLQIEHYAMMRPKLLAYEKDLRGVVSALDGAKPSLEAIRDLSGPGLFWLDRVEANLNRATETLKSVQAPEILADVHATFQSAIRMALDACQRRRTAMASNNMSVAKEASSAAAGAQLLFDQARHELLARLYPPTNRTTGGGAPDRD